MELTLVPAYGRDYKTAEECIEAWKAGKDFKIATTMSPHCGRYTSIRDLEDFPGDGCKIRYNKLMDFILVAKTGEITYDIPGGVAKLD